MVMALTDIKSEVEQIKKKIEMLQTKVAVEYKDTVPIYTSYE